ncbi:hypothetical protein KOXM_11674 [Klebsiella michiganensis]|nr:hypothetical protein KOXM_11674 [Klebsiella michiganensis]
MPLKPPFIICGTKAFDDFRRVGQFIQSGLARLERAAGNGDHRDIDIGAVAGFAGGNGHHSRHIGGRVAQVLSVRFGAWFIEIDKDQLLANRLV